MADEGNQNLSSDGNNAGDGSPTHWTATIEGLDEDTRSFYASQEKITNLAEALKNGAGANKLIGKSIRLPDDGAEPEARDALIRENLVKMGAKTEAKDYKVELSPELAQALGDDKFTPEQAQAFAEFAADAGLLQWQVDKFMAWAAQTEINEAKAAAEAAETETKAAAEAQAEKVKGNKTALGEKWGLAQLDGNFDLAVKAAQQFGSEDLVKAVQSWTDPALINAMYELGLARIKTGSLVDGEHHPGGDAQNKPKTLVAYKDMR